MDAALWDLGTPTADAGTMTTAVQTSVTAARTSFMCPPFFLQQPTTDDCRQLGSGIIGLKQDGPHDSGKRSMPWGVQGPRRRRIAIQALHRRRRVRYRLQKTISDV